MVFPPLDTGVFFRLKQSSFGREFIPCCRQCECVALRHEHHVISSTMILYVIVVCWLDQIIPLAPACVCFLPMFFALAGGDPPELFFCPPSSISPLTKQINFPAPGALTKTTTVLRRLSHTITLKRRLSHTVGVLRLATSILNVSTILRTCEKHTTRLV